jgi:predicted MFS family arabinose efflux permease
MFLMLVGGVLNSFAVNIAMWIVGRAIIGAGVGVVKVRTLLVARSDSDS